MYSPAQRKLAAKEAYGVVISRKNLSCSIAQGKIQINETIIELIEIIEKSH